MSANDIAALAEIAVAIPWASDVHTSTVLTALTPAVATMLPPGKRRRSQQNFLSFCSYGTAAFWGGLAGDAPSGAKLQMVLSRAIRLGLRCPSEHSLKLLCSLWAFVTHSPDELACLAPATKPTLLRQVKVAFDVQRKAMPDPVEWLDKLPEDPVVLLRDHQVSYSIAFPGTHLPVRPAVDFTELGSFDASYSCRGGAQAAGGSQAPLTIPLGGGGQDVMAIAAQFMGRMEAMQSTQARMFDAMMGGGGVASGSGSRVPRSLAALSDRVATSAVPFAQQLALPQPAVTQQLALQMPLRSPQPQVEEMPESPPAKECGAVAPAGGELVDVASPTAAAGGNHIEDMLDALTTRTKARADAKAIASATGVATAVPVAVPKCPAKAAAAAAAPAPKGKAKAAGKGKAAAPKGKAAGPKGKAAGPKGKAKAAPMAADLIRGCAKCRFSISGCAQCRDPSFTGHRWNSTCAA